MRLNKYYVYEHIRLDNMTCFYVGKGVGYRAYEKGRNNHHDKIAKKHGYLISMVAENLTEQEAHELERELIEEYVFELGYGINIKGYRNYDDGIYLTNATWGGEGCSGRTMSDETKEKIRKANIGRKHTEETKMINRMRNFGRKHTKEAKIKIGLAGLGRNSGSDNWQAKKVICLNNEEVFETIKEASQKYNLYDTHIIDCCKHKSKYSGNLDGEHMVWMYYEEYTKSSQEKIEKILKEGLKKKNHQSHKIICLTTKKVFNSIEEAKDFYGIKSGSGIGHCCKKQRKTAGKYKGEKLSWMYLDEYIKEVET